MPLRFIRLFLAGFNFKTSPQDRQTASTLNYLPAMARAEAESSCVRNAVHRSKTTADGRIKVVPVWVLWAKVYTIWAHVP